MQVSTCSCASYFLRSSVRANSTSDALCRICLGVKKGVGSGEGGPGGCRLHQVRARALCIVFQKTNTLIRNSGAYACAGVSVEPPSICTCVHVISHARAQQKNMTSCASMTHPSWIHDRLHFMQEWGYTRLLPVASLYFVPEYIAYTTRKQRDIAINAYGYDIISLVCSNFVPSVSLASSCMRMCKNISALRWRYLHVCYSWAQSWPQSCRRLCYAGVVTRRFAHLAAMGSKAQQRINAICSLLRKSSVYGLSETVFIDSRLK